MAKTQGSWYEVQVGEHFSSDGYDEEELAWLKGRQEVTDDGLSWSTYHSGVEGLIEAEGKKKLLEKTYRNVRVVNVVKTVVESV